ncbi:titin [Amia ocellicauda]|uniref:titin n=1 Tax=Amia ocellicauda TaxID=2972642 RepID=UPI0034648A9A
MDNRLPRLARAPAKLRYFTKTDGSAKLIPKPGSDIMNALEDFFDESDSSPLTLYDLSMPTPVPQSSSTPRVRAEGLVRPSIQPSNSADPQFQALESELDVSSAQKTKELILQNDGASDGSVRGSPILFENEVVTPENSPTKVESAETVLSAVKLPVVKNVVTSLSTSEDEFVSLPKKKTENHLLKTSSIHSCAEERKMTTCSNTESALLKDAQPESKGNCLSDAPPCQKLEIRPSVVEKESTESVSEVRTSKKGYETSMFLQRLRGTGPLKLPCVTEKETLAKDPQQDEMDEEFMVVEEEHFNWRTWISIPKKKQETSNKQPKQDENEKVEKPSANVAAPSKTSVTWTKDDQNSLDAAPARKKKQPRHKPESQKEQANKSHSNKRDEARSAGDSKDFEKQGKIKTASRAKVTNKRKSNTDDLGPLKAKLRFTEEKVNVSAETQGNKNLPEDQDINDHVTEQSPETFECVTKPGKWKNKKKTGNEERPLKRSSQATQELLKQNKKAKKKSALGIGTSSESSPGQIKRERKKPGNWWLVDQEESGSTPQRETVMRQNQSDSQPSADQVEVMIGAEEEKLVLSKPTQNQKAVRKKHNLKVKTHQDLNLTKMKAKLKGRAKNKSNMIQNRSVSKSNVSQLQSPDLIENEVGKRREASKAVRGVRSVRPLPSSQNQPPLCDGSPLPTAQRPPLKKNVRKNQDGQYLKGKSRKETKYKSQLLGKSTTKINKRKGGRKATAPETGKNHEQLIDAESDDVFYPPSPSPSPSRVQQYVPTPDRKFPKHAVISEEQSARKLTIKGRVMGQSGIHKRHGNCPSPMSHKRQRKPPGNWWEIKGHEEEPLKMPEASRKRLSILKKNGMKKQTVDEGTNNDKFERISGSYGTPLHSGSEHTEAKCKSRLTLGKNVPKNVTVSLATFDEVYKSLITPNRMTTKVIESSTPAPSVKNKILVSLHAAKIARRNPLTKGVVKSRARKASTRMDIVRTDGLDQDCAILKKDSAQINLIPSRNLFKKDYFSPAMRMSPAATPTLSQVNIRPLDRISLGSHHAKKTLTTPRAQDNMTQFPELYQDAVSPHRAVPTDACGVKVLTVPRVCPVSARHLSGAGLDDSAEVQIPVPSDLAADWNKAQPSGNTHYQGYESGPSSIRTITYEDDGHFDNDQENTILGVPSSGRKSRLQASKNPQKEACLNKVQLSTEERRKLYLWLRDYWSISAQEFTQTIILDKFQWYECSGKYMGLIEDFECTLFRQGKMLLGSFMKKEFGHFMSNSLVFNILNGYVNVKVGFEEQDLSSGDIFYVPSGQMYSVCNLTEEPALFLYTQLLYSNN